MITQLGATGISPRRLRTQRVPNDGCNLAASPIATEKRLPSMTGDGAVT